MRILPILLALLFPVASFAQGIAPEKDIVLANGNFQERMGETSKVSGDIIMGVMLTGDDASALAPAITTGRPADWESATAQVPVCVRLVSKDGRYEAENTYLVPPGYAAGAVPFPYLGKHAADLESRKAVALVRAGACGNRNQPVIPSRWRLPAEGSGGALHIYLNSAGNPASVAVGRGDRFFEPCENVAELTGLKYTAHCVIPLDMLPEAPDPARLTFFITRANTEESFPVEVLSVLPND